MTFSDRILHLAQKTVDVAADLWPAPELTAETLKSARVIAHRGYDGPGHTENSVASLSACTTAGIWGVEFDIRWPSGPTPVVQHDPPKVGDPTPATLQAVLQSLAGHCHLMIEVKENLTEERQEGLAKLLSGLTPATDFHLLTLRPEFLASVTKFPKDSFVLVTELEAKTASDYVLDNAWGGVAGHYLLFTNRIIESHRRRRQKVGVGFVASPNNLCRQLARGIDWVFSNNAPVLQAWIKARLDQI